MHTLLSLMLAANLTLEPRAGELVGTMETKIFTAGLTGQALLALGVVFAVIGQTALGPNAGAGVDGPWARSSAEGNLIGGVVLICVGVALLFTAGVLRGLYPEPAEVTPASARSGLFERPSWLMSSTR